MKWEGTKCEFAVDFEQGVAHVNNNVIGGISVDQAYSVKWYPSPLDKIVLHCQYLRYVHKTNTIVLSLPSNEPNSSTFLAPLSTYLLFGYAIYSWADINWRNNSIAEEANFINNETRENEFGSSDSADYGEYNGIGSVEISTIFVTQVSFSFGKISYDRVNMPS